jgi:eukaryotic-like serine/threonine-protein kinase
VGRGGMGVVYEAEQLSLRRRVALKVLPLAAALDPQQLRRFQLEAQAAANLVHQNIVAVHAVGCERGVHYYAMQFIDGQTLAAMIAELRPLEGRDREDRASTAVAGALAAELASGRWAPPQRGRDNFQLTGSYTEMPSPPEAAAGSPSTPAAADMATQRTAGISTDRSTKSPAFFRTVANLGVQAAEALEHAHGVGVTHRDIKPANLLVDMRGNLWITDFGLSHCQAQAGLTMTGDLVGTLRYMSPEQALAQRVVIDHRTDIYSLGATLYELLTLEPVFHGRDRQELLRQIAFEEPKSPRRLNKSIPTELETIVLKALEKNPVDRYASAQDLADDLGRFLRDESIRAKRPSPLQRARKWARRHQGVVRTALVALALLLAIVTVGASLAAWRLNEEQNATREQLRLTEEAQEQATHRLFDSRVSQAKAGRLSRQPGQRFASLKAIEDAVRIARELSLPEERFDELRNEAIACLAVPDLRPGKSWNALVPGTACLAFDGDYQRYARANEQGSISVRRVADDQELARLDAFGKPVQSLLFSPDGQFLAVHAKDGRMQVWHVERGQAILAESSPGSGWDFSPDSRQIAMARPDRSIEVLDLGTGKETRRLRAASAQPRVAFDPDGRRLAVIYAAKSAPVQSGTWHPGPLYPSGSSQRLAFATWRGIPTASVSPSPLAVPPTVPRYGMWRPDGGSPPWKGTGRM